MAPIYNILPDSESVQDTESEMPSEDEARDLSDGEADALEKEDDADQAMKTEKADELNQKSAIAIGNKKPSVNCIASDLQSLELDDGQAAECSNGGKQARSNEATKNPSNQRGAKYEKSNLVDTVTKKVKKNNSDKDDKQKKTADSNVPGKENQATSASCAQSTKTQQRHRRKQNSRGPAEREESRSQPTKEYVRNHSNNSRPRGAENDEASTSGVQTDQKGAVTFGSKSFFFNPASEEFIRKEKYKTKKIKQLNLSARIVVQAGMEIALNNNGCLMVVDDDFVAEVRIEQPDLLDEARNLWQAKQTLLKQIRIVAVLIDKPVSVLAKHREAVVISLGSLLKESSSDQRKGIACLQMVRLTEKFSNTKRLTYFRFFQEIEKNEFLCEELKEQITMAQEVEKAVFKRSHVFSQFGYRIEDESEVLYQKLLSILLETLEHHKNALSEVDSDISNNLMSKISRMRFMLATKKDLKLFSDMKSVLNKEIFSNPLEDMEKRWFRKIEAMQTPYSNNCVETTNGLFFFLCKSLQELILEISELSDMGPTQLLSITCTGWRASGINWKEENLLTKCLERQYSFIFHLLEYFSLGVSIHAEPFQYEIKFLNKFEKNPSMWNGVKSMLNRTNKLFDTKPNHSDLPEEIYVWYCLLDDVLYNVLPKNADLKDTESALQSYLKLIREVKIDQLETLRVATHNTIRFIVQVVPYMSFAEDSSPVDRCILHKQMAITSVEEPSSNSTTQYRDLVNVFNSYWKFRSDVVTEIVSRMPLPGMTLLKEQLLNIVSAALEKTVDRKHVVTFFRTYEEFLINLNEVSFDWYIKGLSKVNMQGVITLKKVEAVNNKLKGTFNATYRVLDPKNFASFCRSLGYQSEAPKHYVIEILRKLLAQVESQLEKENWTSGERLTEEDKLSTTCDLLAALHQSLLFMKEQPEYISFELFYDESVKPFVSLIENSMTRQDFSARVHLLKESYWFFRKQNDISVDTALQLYKNLNAFIDTKLLKKQHQRYTEHFEQFMRKSEGKNSHDASFLISQTVKDLNPKAKLFTTWDVHYKQNKVPQILAGLAAVWSIHVSKDVSSTGKYLSPHCIQIICVLRLLSTDKVASGIDKHLAQVLTGQGKSLILALVAAFLALTGHKVDIGCYSRYLVERDRDNFNTFYSMFNVKYDVTYGTIDRMMEKFISPRINGQTKGLRNLVNDLLMNKRGKEPSALLPIDFSKNVLLIDEVDVFFTEQFYGSTYGPCVTPVIEGLAAVQVFIWKTVSVGNSSIEDIIRSVWIYVNMFNFQGIKTFINKRDDYELLTNDCTLKTFHNESLFDQNLRAMVNCAIEVFQSTIHWSKFKLNASGIITYNVKGEYVEDTILGYHNIFNYFRLKKCNFVPQINGQRNYGYLNVSCGSLSYAMLPMNYPLIVGVSGTLTDLNEYEKQAVEQMYGIKKMSVMPTFFGSSNFIFDAYTDFNVYANSPTWKQCIFSRANQMVVKNRAVLIFFETDVDLESFKSAYRAQIDRLNVLTENTIDKEKIINEAGIAKTVTLATRGMGRGVDYKSSVMVEKNGGVHVIQTFFSMDVKEETQIKGRTARQDNKGSYEMILCRETMNSALKVLQGESYYSLSKKRQEFAIEANKVTSEAIERNKSKHNVTMNYMKSFFRGW